MPRHGRIAVAAMGLFGALSLSTTAHATTPLSINLGCIPEGASVIDCFADITGGAPPYTIHWSTNTTVTVDRVSFHCDTGKTGTVTITVTDAAHTTLSRTAFYTCIGGPPRL